MESSREFDPYADVLGIPPSEQPPHFYRLLQLPLFESDPAVIDEAAERLRLQLRAELSGPHEEQVQRLLADVEFAHGCLHNAICKAEYDARLQSAFREYRRAYWRPMIAACAIALIGCGGMVWAAAAAEQPRNSRTSATVAETNDPKPAGPSATKAKSPAASPTPAVEEKQTFAAPDSQGVVVAANTPPPHPPQDSGVRRVTAQRPPSPPAAHPPTADVTRRNETAEAAAWRKFVQRRIEKREQRMQAIYDRRAELRTSLQEVQKRIEQHHQNIEGLRREYSQLGYEDLFVDADLLMGGGYGAADYGYGANPRIGMGVPRIGSGNFYGGRAYIFTPVVVNARIADLQRRARRERQAINRERRQAGPLCKGAGDLRRAWVNELDLLGRLSRAEQERAIEWFTEQIASDDLSPLAYAARGVAYMNVEQYDRAVADMQTAAEADVSILPLSVAVQGRIAGLRGEDGKAKDLFREAIGHDRSFGVAYLYRGVYFLRREEYPFALASLKAAARLMPDNAEAHAVLADLLVNCPDKKIRDPLSALSLSSQACDNSQWQYWQDLALLADNHAALGGWDEAVTWGARALDIAPPEHQSALRNRLADYRSKADR